MFMFGFSLSVVDEATVLMKSCLQEAKDVRQELLAYKKNTPNGSVGGLLS